jgi:hypothetical protein
MGSGTRKLVFIFEFEEERVVKAAALAENYNPGII